MTETHTLIWHFDVANAKGEVKRFQCAAPIDPSEWDDDVREAAIFLTFQEREYLAKDGWHIQKPATIQVFALRPLSDIALA